MQFDYLVLGDTIETLDQASIIAAFAAALPGASFAFTAQATPVSIYL